MGSCITCIKNNPQSNYIMNPIKLLERIDPKTVPKVPFQDKIIYARIEEIYDGETPVPAKLSLRILGIDI